MLSHTYKGWCAANSVALSISKTVAKLILFSLNGDLEITRTDCTKDLGVLILNYTFTLILITHFVNSLSFQSHL